MCLYKPWKSKTLAFFDDKRSKSGPRNFFKDFGCIILFKTLTGLIRAINRTNSWLNQTCRGDKRCQWRKEDHDSSRDPPKKKNAQLVTSYSLVTLKKLKKLNLEGSIYLIHLLKCCIIANYQYKHFEQKGFSHIQSINAVSRFEFFCHNCKGKVKELVTSY